MWVFNIILAQSASLSISNIAKPVQIFYVIFRIMENWRIDMILLCLKWFCSIENLIEWLNSRKAYKKQTLILLEKYLERKSERPGKIFPIQMEREKIGYFPFTSERGKLESLSENFGKNNALLCSLFRPTGNFQ